MQVIDRAICLYGNTLYTSITSVLLLKKVLSKVIGKVLQSGGSMCLLLCGGISVVLCRGKYWCKWLPWVGPFDDVWGDCFEIVGWSFWVSFVGLQCHRELFKILRFVSIHLKRYDGLAGFLVIENSHCVNQINFIYLQVQIDDISSEKSSRFGWKHTTNYDFYYLLKGM